MDGLHYRSAQGHRGESIMGPEGLAWQHEEKLWSDVIDEREVGEMECLKVCEQKVHAFSRER